MNQIQSIRIDDDLDIQDHGAIEVSVLLKSGERRWCFIFKPEAMSKCGDWIEGTRVPFHYGAPHRIVIGATLTEALIERAILDLDAQGLILECTLPSVGSADAAATPPRAT